MNNKSKISKHSGNINCTESRGAGRRYKNKTKAQKINKLKLSLTALVILTTILGTKGLITYFNAKEASSILQTSSRSSALSEAGQNSDRVTWVQTTEADGVTQKRVPVPKGFSASQVDGENTVDGGFVIYEIKGDDNGEWTKADMSDLDWSKILVSSGTQALSQASTSSLGRNLNSTLNTTNSSLLNNAISNETVTSNETTNDESTNNPNNEENEQSETESNEQNELIESQNQNSNENEAEESKTQNNSSESQTLNALNSTNTQSTYEQTTNTQSKNTSNNLLQAQENNETSNVNETANSANNTAKSESQNTNESAQTSESETQNDNGSTTNESNSTENENNQNDETANEQTQNEATQSQGLTKNINQSTVQSINGTATLQATGDTETNSEGDSTTQEEINIFNLQKTHNQYVWVPIDDVTQLYGVDSNGKLWGKLYNYRANSRSNYNWTESSGIMSITNVTNYREPDVTKYRTDYDIDSKLNNYLYGESQYELLSKEMNQNFYEMIKSIEKYGGFYIGRYETGRATSTQTSQAVVRKMNTNISSITWYNSYKGCKNLRGDNENIVTSLISGTLWDATLDWIAPSVAIPGNSNKYSGITNSTTWGNYGNSRSNFYYIKSDATEPIEIEQLTSNAIIPAGSTEYTNANNIYDLAGNVFEWTLEANSTIARVCRGGGYNNFGSSLPASYRGGSNPTNPSANYRFSCLLLY